MKIAFVRAYEGGRMAGERVFEAAEATGDPARVDEARRLRSDRGEVAPFEGLVPGAVTAGAMAKERARGDEERTGRRTEGGRRDEAPGSDLPPGPDELSPREVAVDVLSLFGVPAHALDQLPEGRRREVEHEIAEMIQRPPSFRSADRLVELILEMGFDRLLPRAPQRDAP